MLPGPLRWRWGAVVPLNLLAAGVEAVGAALVFGFLGIVARRETVSELPLIDTLVPLTGATSETQVVVRLGLALVIFYVMRNLVLGAIAYVHEGLVQESVVKVSDRLLWGYLHAPYPFHLARNSASLIQRLQVSVDTVYQLVLSAAAHLAGEVLVALGLIAVLAAVSPLLTLGAVALTAGLLLMTDPLVKRFFRRSGARQAGLEESFLSGVQQSLGAFKEVRVAGRERFFHERIIGQRTELGRLLHHRAALTASLRLVIETAFLCAMLAVVVVLTLRFGPGADVISVVGLFAYATFRLVPTANRLNLYINQGRSGQAFVDLLYDDYRAVAAGPPQDHEPLPMPLPCRGSIRLDGVSFAYPSRPRDAVHDVTLTIQTGESIGIVGPSGAGKSTLVNLLLGLLEPQQGRILVDGVDIRTERRRWQAQIGYVPQEFHLVDDTVRRNIAFGVADSDIDEERVRSAVRWANLEDLVTDWPEGLDTLVGERGVRLSGGERQRVAIARALYRDPQVLIFDEGLAAVDPETEAEIMHAVETLHGERTLVVVAHRPSTVRRCDRIIVMDAGRTADADSRAASLTQHRLLHEVAGTPTSVRR